MGHFRSIICGLAVEVNALRVLHKLISRANQASVPRRNMLIALQSFSHLFSKFYTLKLNLRVVKFKRIFFSHEKFLARVEWFLLLTNWTMSERWQVAITKNDYMYAPILIHCNGATREWTLEKGPICLSSCTLGGLQREDRIWNGQIDHRVFKNRHYKNWV